MPRNCRLLSRRPGLSALLAVALAWPLGANLQVEPCDPELDVPSGNPLGYRLRGDRCEGLYVQEVSSTTLHVASLTTVFENFDARSGKDLLVEWRDPGAEEIRIRAYGLKRRLHYRLDSRLPAGHESFRWSVDILAALDVARRDVGVVAWTRKTLGGTERSVYVPLKITQTASAPPTGGYELVMMPGQELEEVYVSVAPVGADGRPTTFFKDGEALGYGYYPAGRSISIPIDDPGEEGIYYLEIGALLKRGGATTTELWLFHPSG